MSGFWGSIVIGVQYSTFKEIQQMYASLGLTIDIEKIIEPHTEDGDHEFENILIGKIINLDDHPQQGKYSGYNGDFYPQYDSQWGYEWDENGGLKDIVIGVLIYDSYHITNDNHMPWEYITSKLEEMRDILPTAKAYFVHFHS